MKYFFSILLFSLFSGNSFSQVLTNNGAVANILSGAVVNGGSLENTTGTITNAGTLTLAMDFTNSATVNGSGSYNIGGNWSNSGTFTPGTGTVTFNGTGAQSITATTFNNLTFNKASGSASLTGNLSINSNLAINSGTFDLGTYIADRASAGGTLTVSNGAALKIGGTNTVPSNYSTHSIGTTSTIDYNGTNQSILVLNSAQDYGQLTISGSGTKTLAGDLNVRSTLTFTGATITTGASTLYLNPGGVVSRTSGHVIGNFKKNIAIGASNTTFEIGDATGYTPVTVAFPSVTTTGDLTAITAAGDHANIGSSFFIAAKTANRNWTLINNGVVFTTYDATFTFVAGDVDAGATPGNFIIGRYSGGWTYPAIGTQTSTTTQATGLASFGDFQSGEIYATKIFTGTGSFSDPTKWTGGTLPTIHENLVIDGACTVDNYAGTDNIAYGTLTIGTATGRTLSWAAGGTNRLNVTNVSAGAGASTLNMTNGGTLIITGTWVSTNLTFTSGTGTIEAQSTIILPAAYANYNNLTINGAGVTISLGVATVVRGNLTITAGTFDANNFNLTVGGNWANNVSTTAFTAGTAIVTFNNTTAKAIGGSFATTFNDLTIACTGSTVTLNSNAGISGNLFVSIGTFDLAGFTANRASAGGTLTVSNNATLRIVGTNSYPTNYTTNTLVVASNVEYAGTNQTVANQTYGNLKLSSSGGAAIKTFPGTALAVVGNLISTLGAGTSVTFTAASNITVGGNVSIGASTTFNGSSYSHSVAGNWVNSGTFNGNTGTITFTGAGTSVSGSGTQNFNNLTVAATPLSFSAVSITLTGNLATSGAGSFSQASGGTLLMSGTGTTISGTGISLDNLTVSGSVSTTYSLNLTGNLAVNGTFTASIGTITMSGASKTMSGAGTKAFDVLSVTGSITTNADFSISSSLTVNGSFSASAGTATFMGTSSLSGTANLYDVTINGTALQLGTNSQLGIANTLTITSGTLNVADAPNTVNFNGTGAQSINGITYSNLTLSNNSNKTAAADIVVNNDITINATATFIPSSYTISIYGDWINNGTFSCGTSTVQFLGSATTHASGATTFNILTSNTSSSTTELILQSNITAAVVNMTNGIILTGPNTLTITNTRTGNGFIRGTIQRTHAFTTGVSYAFEGPDNTITFASVSSVTSITVFIEEESVTDFPFGSSINREYNITVPAGTYNATLRLHYEDDELNGNDESSMGLWNYDGSVWQPIGKTANSTSSNYVEQSGLADITNRWALSDDANVVEWNGSVSTDWHTAANWTTIQGAPSKPPSPLDIAQLGTAIFTYEPTISASESVNSIHLGSTQAVTLTLGSGGSLVTGNIDGDWTADAIHTINVNDQNLTVNGDMNLSDGINGQSVNLNIGSGDVHIVGSLLESGDANITFTDTGTLNIHADFNYSGGIFSAGNGKVVYMGAENQDVANVTYNDLTIDMAAGIASINDTVAVLGNLLIASGELDNYSTTAISGNVTIDFGSTLQNFQSIYVGGNWTNNGTDIPNGSSIFFNGNGTQYITAAVFGNLNINKPSGTAILTGDLTIAGNLIITSGTLDFQTYFIYRNVPGGFASIADGATGIIGGNNGPSGFSINTLGAASTVIFNGADPQYLVFDNITFGNLIFRNAGTKILLSPAMVNGDFTIDSGASLDAGSYVITLNGNWINHGTLIPSTSTILCTGTSKTILGNTTFNNATIVGSYTGLSDFIFNGLLNVTSTGSLSSSGAAHTLFNGDLTNSGTIIALGTSTFSCNVLQHISFINAATTVALTVIVNGTVSPVINSTSSPQFGYITINNTGGISPPVGWTVLYSLTIGSGATFNGGISTHNILGAFTNSGTVTSTGILNFMPTLANTLNLGSNFSSTGRVIFGGAAAITLTGTPTSFHDIVISNTNGAGITPSSDWTITNNFTLNNGSTLNAGSHSYFVGGILLNNGTVNSGTSTFSFNGSTNQTVPSITYYNLDATSSGGVVTLRSATVNNDLSVTTGTMSIGNDNTARTIAVNGNITIASGATLNVAATSDATHLLTVSGNITNSGILNLRPDGNSLCNTTFNKNGIQTVAGSGSTTSFNKITTNMGAINSNYLDVTATNFSAPNSFLTLNNGSFNLNSAGISLTPFTTDITTGNFLIPATAGLWVTAGTINSSSMNWTVAGLVQVTGGTLNIGTATDNVLIPKSTGNFVETAGNFNLASRISNPGATWSLLMQGGTMTVNTQGSTTTDVAPFNMDATGSVFNMSAGTIMIQNAGGSAGQNLGYNNLSTSGPGFTGGTLQIGNASTPSAQTIGIVSTNPIYNLEIGSNNATVLLTADLAVSNNVTVTAGTLNIDSQALKIGGSISNSGTFIVSNGTIELNGSSAQTIPASAFEENAVKDLIINSAAGVTLSDTLKLSGILTASNGQFATGDYLTLLSTPAKTALISGIGTGDVLGNVTMQRYLVSGFGYKYISSPFQAALVNELGDDMDLTNSFPGFYRYDEDTATSGWLAYTDTTGLLYPMQGYAANLGADSSSKTIDITGVVSNDTVSCTLYNHDRLFTRGFNLVGNPYPSPIDWDNTEGWIRTNVDDAVYYFNAGDTDQYTGTYSSYVNGISSDSVAVNIIPAMQGFFVHVTDGSYPVAAQLSVNNSARSNDFSPVFHRPASLPLLRLSAGFSGDGTNSDPTVFYFDEEATTPFNKNLDALKLMNTNSDVPNLYAVSPDSTKLSIRAVASPHDSLTMLPLGLKTGRNGDITFNARNILLMPDTLHIYLLDNEKGIYHDLRKKPDYRLYLGTGKYENRFFVVFSLKELNSNSTDNEVFEVYISGGQLFINSNLQTDENSTLVISSMLGSQISRQQFRGNGSYDISPFLSSGMYIVSLFASKEVRSKKIIIAN